MSKKPTYEELEQRIIELEKADSERKRIEKALRESEQCFSIALENLPGCVSIHDLKGNFLFVNDVLCRNSGYSKEALLIMSVQDLDPGSVKRNDPTRIWRNLQTGESITLETTIKKKDGHEYPNKVCLIRIQQNGKPVILSIHFDISERKHFEQELQAHLYFLESMDKVNEAMQGTNDLEQMMRDVLDVVLSTFDCDRAALLYPLDIEASSLSAPMERTKPEYPGIHSLGIEVPIKGETLAMIQKLLDIDGPLINYVESDIPQIGTIEERIGPRSTISMAIYPKNDRPWEFIIQQCSHLRKWTPEEERLFQEIGRRLADGLTGLLAYRNLQKSQEFLNNIVDNIPDLVFVKDVEDLKFIMQNKKSLQITGYSQEELIGKTAYDLFPKELADSIVDIDREVLSRKELLDIPEETFQTRDNKDLILHTQKIPILDESGEPKYLLGISEDITERRNLEEQFRQAQKMEGIGRLAGGIAHDFNNMLGVIIGHTELALDEVDPSNKVFAHLKGIQKAADRSADLTRQLLGFARKQTVSPIELDLNEAVEKTLNMLRRLIGEDINLAWLPGSGIWSVKADPSQIDQILANLCVNARDAIQGIGKVTIETSNMTFDEAYCKNHVDFIPGEYVLLAVSDDGSGMEKEILDKLFEPFFTTKEQGKGTGLGLATVYGIVKQNDGFINVYSEPGHGTTFKIYLPRHTPMPGHIPKKSQVIPVSHGIEIILLVEDDPTMLELSRIMLEKLGYRVLVASTPNESVRIAKEYSGKINLLITDVVMPEMNGRELVEKILSLYPDMKYIYMSGYTNNVIAHHGVLDEGVNFIQKPFSTQILAAKVREVLDNE